MLTSLTLQKCDNCGKENPINATSLKRIGNIIALSSCLCDTTEFLHITTVDENPYSHATLVRKLAEGVV